MAKYTEHLNLKKPEPEDFYNVQDFNDNADMIDECIKDIHIRFNNHHTNEDNPHGVTAEQVGLGNVPNVATNDQTPTYTDEDVPSTLINLLSGEKLSITFGKIKKAITDLIAHIADTTMHNHGTSGGGAVGTEASTTRGGAVGTEAISGDGGAVGLFAEAAKGGAIGSGAVTGDGFAGGNDAETVDANRNRIDAIQLGTGKNQNPKTLQVYDYQLMNANGYIPSDRLAIKFDSYLGNGKVGSANPNTLSFDFEIECIVFWGRYNGLPSILYRNDSTFYTVGMGECLVTWSADKKTVSWYHDGRYYNLNGNPGGSADPTAARQANTDKSRYYYMAIGRM